MTFQCYLGSQHLGAELHPQPVTYIINGMNCSVKDLLFQWCKCQQLLDNLGIFGDEE
jgi:hypothetical protein